MAQYELPTIDLRRCIGCGLCAQRCPAVAVEMVEARPVFYNPAACTYCGECEEVCPAGAIALQYEIVLLPKKRSRS